MNFCQIYGISINSVRNISGHDFQWLWERISGFCGLHQPVNNFCLISRISVKSLAFLSNVIFENNYVILSQMCECQLWYCNSGWHQIGSGCSLNFCQQLWISVKSNFCQIDFVNRDIFLVNFISCGITFLVSEYDFCQIWCFDFGSLTCRSGLPL